MNQNQFQQYYLEWANHINIEIDLIRQSINKLIQAQEVLSKIVELNESRMERLIERINNAF